MCPKLQKKITNSILFKILVAAILMILIIRKVDINEIAGVFRRLDQFYLVLAIILTVGAVIISAYKWQILLAARGWGIHLATLTKIYFVGLFMNNFLPSSIGGDLMRIYRVGKIIDDHSESAASVVLERLLATVGLILPAAWAVIPNRELLGSIMLPMILCIAVCLLILYLFVNPAVLRPLTRLPWKWWQNIVQRLQKMNGAIQNYRSKPGTVVKVISYSVMFQLTIVLINYYLLKAMDINSVTLWQCTLVVPLISAISMIPVSINGLGIREGAYVLLFGPIGLSTTQAVTLSMLFFLIVTAVSLLGGLIFAIDGGSEQYVVSG